MYTCWWYTCACVWICYLCLFLHFCFFWRKVFNVRTLLQHGHLHSLPVTLHSPTTLQKCSQYMWWYWLILVTLGNSWDTDTEKVPYVLARTHRAHPRLRGGFKAGFGAWDSTSAAEWQSNHRHPSLPAPKPGALLSLCYHHCCSWLVLLTGKTNYLTYNPVIFHLYILRESN